LDAFSTLRLLPPGTKREVDEQTESFPNPDTRILIPVQSAAMQRQTF
jgi:hypothetical protein